MNCKICGTQAESFATGRLRQKHQVQYFACPNCEFIQTEEPYWLTEAYAEPINRSDVGYVARNLRLAKATRTLILFFFEAKGRFIDYGGGYGMLVRLMRDEGFDFYRLDKHCHNLFAPDFEAETQPRKQFELLTTFEVFEHLPDPMAEIERMLSFSDHIFFSTELQPHCKPALTEWKYYALEHGQHVSFYSHKSLEEIARRFQLKLYSEGVFYHLLTRRSLSPVLFKLAVNRRLATLIHYLCRQPSLAPADAEKVVQAINNSKIP